jgi:hypothetical protein
LSSGRGSLSEPQGGRHREPCHLRACDVACIGLSVLRLEDLNERRRLRVLFAGLLLHESPQLVIRQQMGNASACMTAHYTGEIPVEV